MKSKKLPKDTKVAVYMRVGREEQLTFKFTEQEVRILRDSLLHHPEGAELFERLGNSLRDYRGKEKERVDRSTEES